MNRQTENRILRAFRQLGVTLKEVGGNQLEGVCPFCGKINKFRVNDEKGLWDCKVCGKSGNLNSFMTEINHKFVKNLTGRLLRNLMVNRNLKLPTLRAFDVGYDIANGNYTIPETTGKNRTITNIHRFTIRPSGNTNLGITCGTHSLICPKKQLAENPVYLMEGEWDTMAMYECKPNAKVIGVPGANTFPKDAVGLFYGKDVKLFFDNDTAGSKGMRKVANMLNGIARSIQFIHWGSDLADGFDFRDLKGIEKDPVKVALSLLRDTPPDQVDFVPDEISGDKLFSNNLPSKELTLSELESLKGKNPAISYKQVFSNYKKNLHMKTDEHLSVMFGAVLANRLEGDPLWLFMVAPPGGMKTELLMSLNTCPLITTTTSITPATLVSGANFAGGDPSLVPKLDKRVLVIKDFTTIMSMNSIAKDEIFGILRDAYDGRTEKQFGNGISRNYESRFGIIAGVTPAIEQFNSNSVLGERFLKYRLPVSTSGTINAIEQALKNIGKENTIRSSLIDTARKVLDRDVTSFPEIDDDAIKLISSLARWVARLRGVVSRERYTNQVTAKPCSEIGTRLAKQLAKLAIGISLYKQEETISDSTYQTITKVAMDTAPDRVEEIIKQLYINRDKKEWFSTNDIAELVRFPVETVRFVLQDLMMLNLVVKQSGVTGGWKLHLKIRKLMESLRLYRNLKP